MARKYDPNNLTVSKVEKALEITLSNKFITIKSSYGGRSSSAFGTYYYNNTKRNRDVIRRTYGTSLAHRIVPNLSKYDQKIK